MGTIFERPDSKYYWYQFTPPNAKTPVKRSTGIVKGSNKRRKEAAKILGQVETDAHRGINTHVYMRTKWEDLKKAVIRDAKERGNRTVYKAEYNLKLLGEFFGNIPILDLVNDRSLIDDYKEHRLKSVSTSTVNRELATLRRGLKLLKETNRIPVDPAVKQFPENNARQMYLTLQEYQRFVASLRKMAPYMVGPVELAVRTGWRRNTILSIEWKHIDMGNELITAPGLLTKNKEPVVYPYDEDDVIDQIIEDQWQIKKDLCPYVFPNKRGTNKIKDFRGVWNKAVKDAAVGDGLGYDAGFDKGFKFHDLKRTNFVLNEEAGLSHSITMDISGTKSETIFKRYNIVDKKRMRKAISMRQEFFEGKTGKAPKKRRFVRKKDKNKAEKKAGRSMIALMEENISRMEYDYISSK